ncbi:MAG: hypothetical protein R3B13_39505 [Polyangiaceae bacterium]
MKAGRRTAVFAALLVAGAAMLPLLACSSDDDSGGTAAGGSGGVALGGNGGALTGGTAGSVSGGTAGIGAAAGSSGASGAGGGIAVEYPAGPYGNEVGDTIANLQWEGYVNETGDVQSDSKPYMDYGTDAMRKSGKRYGLIHISAFT